MGIESINSLHELRFARARQIDALELHGIDPKSGANITIIYDKQRNQFILKGTVTQGVDKSPAVQLTAAEKAIEKKYRGQLELYLADQRVAITEKTDFARTANRTAKGQTIDGKTVLDKKDGEPVITEEPKTTQMAIKYRRCSLRKAKAVLTAMNSVLDRTGYTVITPYAPSEVPLVKAILLKRPNRR
jgi:hypothetical protein